MKNIRQNAPRFNLDVLPPAREKVVYRKELVELLFEQPYCKIEFVVDKLNVERIAAARYLKDLESIGSVEWQKVGRETLYINKELIEILKQ